MHVSFEPNNIYHINQTNSRSFCAMKQFLFHNSYISINKLMSSMNYIICILICVIICSCNKNTCDLAVKAEIKDLTGLDGCGFVIELENGERIKPINYDDFDVELKDGEKIWVSYHLTPLLIGSVCMVGDIVEIDCMTKR